MKRAKDKFNELDVGYFVTEEELAQYTEEERVRYDKGPNKGKLRHYEKVRSSIVWQDVNVKSRLHTIPRKS